MSKKRPSQKSSFDIPPVPKETRFVSSQEIHKNAHFDSWVSDLVGLDYEEMALSPEHQEHSRFFKCSSRRVALHLNDTLYLPIVRRTSFMNLAMLDDGVYFTTHLAIASPDTIKMGIQGLRQPATLLEAETGASSILELLIKLQSTNHILEAYHFEQFGLNEILNGSPWGSALFASFLYEMQPPIEMLTDWQRQLMPNVPPSPHDRGAALLFIGLFASKELSSSFPRLAQYSNSIMPTAAKIPEDQLETWCQNVMVEWIELLLRECGSSPAGSNEEVIMASKWLREAVESVRENEKLSTAAA